MGELKRMRTLLACLMFSSLAATGSANAQSWSGGRANPLLRQIAAVDASGESGWIYGQEDVAGDGATLMANEAGTDIRTVYADSDAQRLWLRAYMIAQAAPLTNLVAYFFIDTDARDDTGGAPLGGPGWPAFRADPMLRGFERAIGVRIEPEPALPSVIGAWNWDGQAWTAIAVEQDAVRAEAGQSRDPLQIGPSDFPRAYVQVDALHAVSGLNASCGGNLLVRTFYEQQAPPRAFGDDSASFACRPGLDPYGDPEIIRVDCSADAECPNGGRCRDGVCLFAYPCSADTDCVTGERCMANACVRVVDRTCRDDSQCEGLVCESGMCVACTENGARACANGYACSPNGRCEDTGAVDPGGSPGGGAQVGEVRGGAFKCSASPASRSGSGWWGLLFALAVFVLVRRLRASLLVVLLVAVASGARAEDIDTQRFLPHATTGGYFQTEGTAVRFPVDPFSLGLWLSYGHNPLISVADGAVVRKQVAHQLAFDLTASYAFARWFELGFHAPVAYLKGDDANTGALGNVRLLPKFRFLDGATRAVGLALLADIRLPTHTNEFYGGARLPGFAPRLLLDRKFGLSGFRLGIDVGVLIQKATEYQNVTAGTELMAGLGMGYRFHHGQAPVELMFDLRSAVGLKETNAEEVGLEGLLGLGIDVARDWKIKTGGGMGLLEGFGIPTARAFFGVRWEPSPNDPDHDGIRSPEPNERSEAYVVKDEPGASDEGADQGEPTSVDDVDDAERAAAIRGGYDACPDLPEDFDGIEDEDGCPEGDSDHDGVLDYLDRCPNEQETINGFEDDDGCEDEGPAQIVIEEGRLTILETIRFEPNSAKLDRRSDRIMEQIALTLRKHEEIKRLEIGGHTDITGPRGLNMRLSRERARSVRQWLLGRGIKPERLGARGYGPDKPVADNETEAGRAKNRRVEFILGR